MTDKRKRSAPEADLAQAKKAAVLGGEKDKKGTAGRLALILLGGLLVGGLSYWYISDPMDTSQGVPGPLTPAALASPTGDGVAHPIAELADGKARFHALPAAGGVQVRYFLLQTKDGRVRAALDACDVCYPAGLGYFQERDHMVCRNCGRRFASLQVGDVRGGCNPVPLGVRVEGDQAVLDLAELRQGRSYFDLKGKGRGGRS